MLEPEIRLPVHRAIEGGLAEKRHAFRDAARHLTETSPAVLSSVHWLQTFQLAERELDARLALACSKLRQGIESLCTDWDEPLEHQVEEELADLRIAITEDLKSAVEHVKPRGTQVDPQYTIDHRWSELLEKHASAEALEIAELRRNALTARALNEFVAAAQTAVADPVMRQKIRDAVSQAAPPGRKLDAARLLGMMNALMDIVDKAPKLKTAYESLRALIRTRWGI